MTIQVGDKIPNVKLQTVVDDGVLKALNIDAPGEVARSSASVILQSL